MLFFLRNVKASHSYVLGIKIALPYTDVYLPKDRCRGYSPYLRTEIGFTSIITKD
jgi:hypothetical protein